MHYQLRPPSVTQQHFCRLTLSRRSALPSWQTQNGSDMWHSKTSSDPYHRFRFSVNLQCYKYRNSRWADNRRYLHFTWNADMVAWFHLDDKSFQEIMYLTSSGGSFCINWKVINHSSNCLIWLKNNQTELQKIENRAKEYTGSFFTAVKESSMILFCFFTEISCRWFEVPWRPCDVNVSVSLINATPLTFELKRIWGKL